MHPTLNRIAPTPRSSSLIARTSFVIAITAAAIIAIHHHGIALGQQTLAPESAVVVDPVDTEATDERSSADNLLRRMTGEGITLSGAQKYVLPAPTFVSVEGESVDEKTATEELARIAGPQGVSRFTRDSVVAPMSTRTETIEDATGKRIGHFIDVAFVVHQSIAEIRNSKTLEDFKSEPGDLEADDKTNRFAGQDDPDEIEKYKTRPLSKSELLMHDIDVDGTYEAVGYLQLPLLSKVVIRGVARARRSVWSTDDEQAPIILTWLLDSRFASDMPPAESVDNQWRPIERNEVGEKFLGPPEPYAGMGGYIAITPLTGNPSASIVQLRFVVHEPEAWFSGRNLLRSKLPILIQDRVRNLRRDL